MFGNIRIWYSNIFEYSDNRIFGHPNIRYTEYSVQPNIRIFGSNEYSAFEYSVVRIFGSTEYWNIRYDRIFDWTEYLNIRITEYSVTEYSIHSNTEYRISSVESEYPPNYSTSLVTTCTKSFNLPSQNRWAAPRLNLSHIMPEQNINSKMSPGSNYSLRGLFRVWHTDSMIHPYMFIIDHTPWPVIDRGQNFVGAGAGYFRNLICRGRD